MNSIKKTLANLTAAIKPNSPSPYKYADSTDDLTWDRARDGLFAEQGTDDAEITTTPYEGGK